MNAWTSAAAPFLFVVGICMILVGAVGAILGLPSVQVRIYNYIYRSGREVRRSGPDPINAEALAALLPDEVLALLQGPQAHRRCACRKYGRPADGSFTLFVIDGGEQYRHTAEQCCPAREYIPGPMEPCSCGRYRVEGGQMFLSWDPRYGCVRHRVVFCESVTDGDWDDDEDEEDGF